MGPGPAAAASGAPPLASGAPPPPPVPPPQPVPPDRILRDALERAGATLGGDGGVRAAEVAAGQPEPPPPMAPDPPACTPPHPGWAPVRAGGPMDGSSPIDPPPPPGPPPVGLEEILGVARARGFTVHGEMFSAKDMAALAQELFHCQAEVTEGGLEGPNRPRLLQHLLGGLPLLVPYDEDNNHEPCCRRGHRAHWAVLTGVLLGTPSPAPSPLGRQDPDIPNLFHARDEERDKGGGFLWGGAPIEGVLVLAQQGKSPRPQLWALGGLHCSNAQLMELSPRRGADGRCYVVPEGGVAQGLGGKAVMLRPPPRDGNGEVHGGREGGGV